MLIYYIVIKPEFLHFIYEVEASVKQTNFIIQDVSEVFGMIIARINEYWIENSVKRLRKIPAIESVRQEIMLFKYEAPAFNIS